MPRYRSPRLGENQTSLPATVRDQMTDKNGQGYVYESVKYHFRRVASRKGTEQRSLRAYQAPNRFFGICEDVAVHKVGKIERDALDVAPLKLVSEGGQQFVRGDRPERLHTHNNQGGILPLLRFCLQGRDGPRAEEPESERGGCMGGVGLPIVVLVLSQIADSSNFEKSRRRVVVKSRSCQTGTFHRHSNDSWVRVEELG